MTPEGRTPRAGGAPPTPAYHRDPELRHLETEVLAVGEDAGRSYVVLADTILYPEGGGQPPDHGRIGGVGVADVQKVAGEIRHYVLGPPPSGPVSVEIDWARRFDHMQQHTGQHLLTAVADTRFGWHTTAFHLGEHTSDIELDVPRLGPDQVTALEEAVAEEIRAARPVTARWTTIDEYAELPVRSRGLPAGHTGGVRLVEIEGLDLNTCGGTHCASTAELEALKLLGTESVRGGTRVFFAVGARLRRTLGAHIERASRLRTLFGVADEELVGAAEARLQQLKDAGRTIRDLEAELATAAAHALAGQPGPCVEAHWPARDLPFLQHVGKALVELTPDRLAFLTAGEGDEGSFLLSAGAEVDVDVAATGRRVAELLDGRGGGSGRLFQGRAARLSQRAEALAVVKEVVTG